MKVSILLPLALAAALVPNGCSRIEDPTPPSPRGPSTSAWPPAVPDPALLASKDRSSPASAPPSSTPDAFGIYRVGDDILEPIELNRVSPVISERYRRGRITQPLYIYEAVITVEGKVSHLRLLGAPPTQEPYITFERAFHDAFVQWRYRPATLNGRPVPVYLTFTGTLEVR